MKCQGIPLIFWSDVCLCGIGPIPQVWGLSMWRQWGLGRYISLSGDIEGFLLWRQEGLRDKKIQGDLRSCYQELLAQVEPQ